MVMTSDNGKLPGGWSVRITTQQLSGGPAMQALFIAGFTSPVDAEEAVKARDGSTPDEKVEVMSPLSHAEMAHYGAPYGEVIAWPHGRDDVNLRAKSIVDQVTRED